MKDNLAKTKWFIFGTYVLLVLVTLFICFALLFVLNVKDKNGEKSLKDVFVSLFETAENRTFDYRQSIQILHKHRKPNEDIVVLEIDDATVESLWEKYGEWPAPRSVYADLINRIEKDKPQAIVFDLMFLKSLKNSPDADKYFIDTLNKFNNVYVGINFDDIEYDVRKPMDLPDKMKVNVNNNSKLKIKTYKNCRTLMPEIMNNSMTQIVSTNVERDDDGILRKIPPMIAYKENFYPYMGFQVAVDYLTPNKNKQFFIDGSGSLHAADAKIKLYNNGEAVLNWYDDFHEANGLSMYKVLNDINSGTASKYNFNKKIIFIGTTAWSLYDIKSVPINREYPGVYVQATSFNNVLDNNFITKTTTPVNIFILILTIAIVGGIVMFSTSTLFATLSTTLFTIAYLLIAYYSMERYNLWIPIIFPLIAIISGYILSLLAKYLMKSRDFEYQYKLATIDGLTELYNHRYFQDTLRQQIEISRRYNQPVSLIICDIDFFKKFNDTYGHQAGDAVLRQVAQTLKKNSRTTDFVCRYGGEEMSIILPNTKADEALLLANRICAAVAEKPFHITPVDTADVTISLGVATFPDNAQTPQDLIEWADKGLYYAKEHGRNQVGRY